MDKTTDKLNEILKNTHPEDLSNFFNTPKQFINEENAFADYINTLLKRYNLKKHDIFIRADIPDRYGYKILSQQKHTIKRDIILRICLAMKISLDEINRCLTLYGANNLYAKSKRDALLISCINHNIYDINIINELLINNHLEKLADCGNSL